MSNATRLPPPRHLVVRLPNPLGDAVMAVPALRALRQALPDTRITWAGGPAPQAALEGLPYRDDVMPLVGRTARGRGATRLLKALGADATLLLPGSWSSAAAAWRARTPVRVGVPGDHRRVLLTHRVEPPRDPDRPRQPLPRPMTAHYLQLAACFGAVDDGRGPELATTPFDEERAAVRLAEVADDARLVGINPGAAFGPTKLLSPDKIAAVVEAIGRRADIVPLVVCGPGEEDLGAATARAIGDTALSFHERVPDLGELKALFRRCQVVLTSDAGPRHVAEALGIPTVVWMGPTDPRWSAHSSAAVIRNESLDCLACHRRTCPIDHPCMRELDPARLAEAALQALRD